MPNKTKQNTKNSTEQICSQPLYKSQTTHHTHPHQQHNTASRLCGQPPQQWRTPTRCWTWTRQCAHLHQTFMPNPKRTHTHHPQTV